MFGLFILRDVNSKIRRTVKALPLVAKSVVQKDVDALLQNIRTNVNSSNDSVYNQGLLIAGITLQGNVPQKINHGLGSKPQTWWACGIKPVNFNPSFPGCWIWQSKEADDKQIELSSNVDVVFDLRIM